MSYDSNILAHIQVYFEKNLSKKNVRNVRAIFRDQRSKKQQVESCFAP